MVLPTTNGLALCAGSGGLELGLHLALSDYRTVCWVENEAYAASALVARMEEAWLDQAPIWADVNSFSGKPWRGLVDLVSAGFPCQPWSTAGRHKGVDDDRWLWGSIRKILRDVEPSVVLLENVPGLYRGGIQIVLGDLADLGFDATWDVFSAAKVGAPHRRNRVFVLGLARRGRASRRHDRAIKRLASDVRQTLAYTQDADGRPGEPPLEGVAGIRRGGPRGPSRQLAVTRRKPKREPDDKARQVARDKSRPNAGGRRRGVGNADQEDRDGSWADDVEGCPEISGRWHVGDYCVNLAGLDEYYRTALGDTDGRTPELRDGQERDEERDAPRSSESVANSQCDNGADTSTRRNARGAPSQGRRAPPPRPGRSLGDADRTRHERSARGRPTTDEIAPFPPGPNDRGAWARVLALRPDLAPATAQPGLRRMVDGSAGRLDALRLAGNGVVPVVVAVAFVTLLDRFEPVIPHG